MTFRRSSTIGGDLGLSRLAGRWAGLVRLAASALFAAGATSILALPWADLSGLLVTSAILLPASLLACAGVFAAQHLSGGRKVSSYWTAHILIGMCFATLLMLGMYASNVLLVDTALQTRTLIGYGLSAVIAGVIALMVRQLHFERLRRLSSNELFVAYLCALGVVLAITDATFLTQGYDWFHYTLVALQLVIFSVAAWMFSARYLGVMLGLASSVLGMSAALSIWATGGSVQRMYHQTLAFADPHQRLLLLAHRLSDADADGFSGSFGGTDCNDADPRSFPLSTRGYDCLGWVKSAIAPATIEAKPPSNSPRPRALVLVTVDAFRCGFGQTGPSELRQACGEIQRLGETGRMRLDAYATCPSTTCSLGSLFSGKPPSVVDEADGVPLVDWFTHSGWTAEAILTHRTLASVVKDGSFMRVDRSLERVASQPSAVYSEQTTDLALKAIRRHFSANQVPPLFLWVHYYDPHAPYVSEPGSPWALGSDITRYAGEVRRTSKAIGRLASTLATIPNAKDSILFLTADHGEEFGEKGTIHHGGSLNDGVVRVPMVAWSPNARLNKSLPGSLPASMLEVGPYLASLAVGVSHQSRQEAFFSMAANSSSALGLYRGGWKLIHHPSTGLTELFHLPSDPLELRNMAEQHPARVHELGRRLAGYLQPPGTDSTMRGLQTVGNREYTAKGH